MEWTLVKGTTGHPRYHHTACCTHSGNVLVFGGGEEFDRKTKWPSRLSDQILDIQIRHLESHPSKSKAVLDISGELRDIAGGRWTSSIGLAAKIGLPHLPSLHDIELPEKWPDPSSHDPECVDIVTVAEDDTAMRQHYDTVSSGKHWKLLTAEPTATGNVSCEDDVVMENVSCEDDVVLENEYVSPHLLSQLVFSERFHFTSDFSDIGGDLQGDSDVILEVPENAVGKSETVTISGAVSVNLQSAHKTLKLGDGETIVSPIVEYCTDRDGGVFDRTLQIYLPHFLPDSFSQQDVRVYVFHKNSDESLSVERLRQLESREANVGTVTDRQQAAFCFTGSDAILIYTSHFTGVVCTNCGKLPPQLHLRLYGTHIQRNTRDVDLTLLIGDRRLLIRDFRQGMLPAEEDHAIAMKNLGPVGHIVDVAVGARLVFAKEYWIHRDKRAVNCFPAEQRVRLVNIRPCCHDSLPWRIDWELEHRPDVTPDVWFSCYVEAGYTGVDETSFIFFSQPTMETLSVSGLRLQNVQKSTKTQTDDDPDVKSYVKQLSDWGQTSLSSEIGARHTFPAGAEARLDTAGLVSPAISPSRARFGDMDHRVVSQTERQFEDLSLGDALRPNDTLQAISQSGHYYTQQACHSQPYQRQEELPSTCYEHGPHQPPANFSSQIRQQFSPASHSPQTGHQHPLAPFSSQRRPEDSVRCGPLPHQLQSLFLGQTSQYKAHQFYQHQPLSFSSSLPSQCDHQPDPSQRGLLTQSTLPSQSLQSRDQFTPQSQTLELQTESLLPSQSLQPGDQFTPQSKLLQPQAESLPPTQPLSYQPQLTSPCVSSHNDPQYTRLKQAQHLQSQHTHGTESSQHELQHATASLPLQHRQQLASPSQSVQHHTPPGELLQHHTLPGELLQHHTPPGELLQHHTPQGKLLQHHTPPGELLQHHTLPGKLLQHHTPPGELLQHHTPPGKLLQHHTPPGELLQHHTPPGELLQHHTPPGELLQHQTPPGELLQHQTGRCAFTSQLTSHQPQLTVAGCEGFAPPPLFLSNPGPAVPRQCPHLPQGACSVCVYNESRVVHYQPTNIYNINVDQIIGRGTQFGPTITGNPQSAGQGQLSGEELALIGGVDNAVRQAPAGWADNDVRQASLPVDYEPNNGVRNNTPKLPYGVQPSDSEHGDTPAVPAVNDEQFTADRQPSAESPVVVQQKADENNDSYAKSVDD